MWQNLIDKKFVFLQPLIYYFFSSLLGHNQGIVKETESLQFSSAPILIESEPNRHRNYKNTSQGMYKMKLLKES